MIAPTCPVCAAPMGDKILVCSNCWPQVPGRDRGIFRKLYQSVKGKGDSWKAKGDEIIAELSVRRDLGELLPPPPAPVPFKVEMPTLEPMLQGQIERERVEAAEAKRARRAAKRI